MKESASCSIHWPIELRQQNRRTYGWSSIKKLAGLFFFWTPKIESAASASLVCRQMASRSPQIIIYFFNLIFNDFRENIKGSDSARSWARVRQRSLRVVWGSELCDKRKRFAQTLSVTLLAFVITRLCPLCWRWTESIRWQRDSMRNLCSVQPCGNRGQNFSRLALV